MGKIYVAGILWDTLYIDVKKSKPIETLIYVVI